LIKKKFFNIFFDSVRIRLESDVPIASFASGGLDSTAIIKALYDMGNKEINTFSITNYEQKYDESKWSNAVAEKYKTNHTQHQLASSISDEDIFKSIDIFDDPYSDPSTVPSYILSKGISSSYKVAISGDGGDELLGGYERLNKTLLKKNALKSSFENLYNLYPAPLGTGNEFLNKSNNIEVAYPSFFEDLKLLGLLDIKPENRFSQEYMHNSDNPYKDLLISDYKFYLYEMMTHKIDRTSMANSLEVRSPFLDHRLIEYIIGSENSYYENSNPKKKKKDYLIKDFVKNLVGGRSKDCINLKVGI
jgi:Asparagine synthase (glutamine-hydrolyzing)